MESTIDKLRLKYVCLLFKLSGLNYFKVKKNIEQRRKPR